MFKAGVVKADYCDSQQDMTQIFREVNTTGYNYGISLVFGNENFRVDYLDYIRIRIGSDSFDSFGISPGILFGSQ